MNSLFLIEFPHDKNYSKFLYHRYENYETTKSSGPCTHMSIKGSSISLSHSAAHFFAVVMLLLLTLVRVSNLCTVGKWWSGLVSRVWSIWDKSMLSVIVLNIKQTITKLGVCLSRKSIYHVSTQSWVLIFYTSKWIWKTIMCCHFHCNSVKKKEII